ncbi:MAG: metallophosphoesterase [Nitrospirota bacterium]
MTLFLLTFFLIYGSMHLYVFLKARSVFAFNTLASIVVALFMLAMIFAPVIVRLSERAGLEAFARLASYAGYMWLGILFLFISVALVIDVYRLTVHASGVMLNKDLSSLSVSKNSAFFIPLSLALLFSIYGYFEAKDIRTETIVIPTPKIPAETGRLRIVQISDVHIGLIMREERLRRILRHVKGANPDILVSTGDLVDGQLDNLSGLSEMLQEVRPRFGKYAVTGNHELYAGLGQAMNFTEKAGFRLLRGEAEIAAGSIVIAGVDDSQVKAAGLAPTITETALLSGFPGDRFIMLLKHRPLIDPNSTGLFDLQLSGHVHKGQIFPFSIITWFYYPTQAGLAQLSARSWLYVSRGSGTWGPPIRLLSPPEVTVIDLIHEDAD